MNGYAKVMIGLVLAFAVFIGVVSSAVAIPRLHWLDQHPSVEYIVDIHK